MHTLTKAFDLRREANTFAAELTNLLNNTVCDGIRITAVTSKGRAVVGYKITPKRQDADDGVPVSLGRRPPSLYLGLLYRLAVDEQQRYLMVTSSFMGLFLHPKLESPLLHYDYERDKADEYPEAHLQVCGASDAWTELSNRVGLAGRPFERLHLPVGGRRYRPTLEDLVEFLVTEKIVDGRPGWTQMVEAGRRGFQERQLRAAIRRNPQVALDILREEGHIQVSSNTHT